MKKINTNKECPNCKSANDVIEIIYGSPTDEVFKEVEKGKLILGGCCIELNHSPIWYCKKCQLEFGIFIEEEE